MCRYKTWCLSIQAQTELHLFSPTDFILVDACRIKHACRLLDNNYTDCILSAQRQKKHLHLDF